MRKRFIFPIRITAMMTENYGTLFSDWMLSEMKQDKTLIAVTAGTPTAGGFTADKRQMAGKQHIDMGIAEEQAVAMISGMAKGGLHPVWTVYSTFIQRTYDQIAQDQDGQAVPM